MEQRARGRPRGPHYEENKAKKERLKLAHERGETFPKRRAKKQRTKRRPSFLDPAEIRLPLTFRCPGCSYVETKWESSFCEKCTERYCKDCTEDKLLNRTEHKEEYKWLCVSHLRQKIGVTEQTLENLKSLLSKTITENILP
jgi:hypothetical protein